MFEAKSAIMSSSARYKFIIASIFIASTAAALVSTEYAEPPFVDGDIIIHDVVKRQVVSEGAILVERNDCTDENENCRRWAKRNFCSHPDYAPYMALKCRRSCYLCEVAEQEVDECRDERDACAYWKKSGNCNKEKSRKFMAINCRRSCGLCPDQVKSTTASTVPHTTTEETTIATTTQEPAKTTTQPKYSEWEEWSACSQTCGAGNKKRTRECLQEKCTSMQVRSCENDPCPTTTTTTEQTTTQAETTTLETTATTSTSSETTSTEAATVPMTTSHTTKAVTEQIKTTIKEEITTATDTTTTELKSTTVPSATTAETKAEITEPEIVSTTVATSLETTAEAELETTTVPEDITDFVKSETTADTSTELVATTTQADTTSPTATAVPATTSVKSQETTQTKPVSVSTSAEMDQTTYFETTSVTTTSAEESTIAENVPTTQASINVERSTSPDSATVSVDETAQVTDNIASETTPNGWSTVSEVVEQTTPMTETTASTEKLTTSSTQTTTWEDVSETEAQPTTLYQSTEPVTESESESTSTGDTVVETTSLATVPTTLPASGDKDCQDGARSCVLLLFSCKTSQFTRNTCKATCGLCKTPAGGVSTTSAVLETTTGKTTLTSGSRTTATTANGATISYTATTDTIMTTGVLTTTKQPTTSRPAVSSCTDRLTNCQYFFIRGCSSAIMKTFCKATCKLCGSSTMLPPTASTPDVITTPTTPQTTSSQAFLSTEATSPVISTTLAPSTTVLMTSSIPATAMTSPAETTTQSACVDLYDECANISAYCGIVANVTKSCPRTCGQCDDVTSSPAPTTAISEICEDTFPNCIALLDQCEDEEAIQYLSVTCRKTCRFCVAPTAFNVTTSPETTTAAVECVDTNVKCAEWSQYGLCNSTIYPEMMEYMQDSCQKSCNLCNTESWSTWSSCSVTCGGGEERRTKACNEDNCTQPATETRSCNIEACPTSKRCFDGMTTKACQQYKAKNACYTTLVQGLCPKTCGVCVDESANNTTDNVNGTQSNTTNTAGNSTCEDTNELCGNWSSRGFCTNTYTTYMKQNCPRSCGLCSDSVLNVWNAWGTWSPCNATCGGGVMTRNRTCQSTNCQGPVNDTTQCNTFVCSTCYDQSSACNVLSQAGKCSETMWKFLCRRSCKLCTSPPITGPCYDTRTDCVDLRTAGRCSSFAVETACPRSCEKCPVVEETTVPGQCVDTNINCPTAATMGKCTDPRVQAICPLSCQKCTTQNIGSTAVVVETNPAAGECVDTISLCANLGANCANNSVVRENCPKTCGLCPEPCVDKNTLCPGLAQAGQCSMKIVTAECPLSCQACNQSSQVTKTNLAEPSTCEDKLGSCPKLVDIMNCTNRMVLESCAKSCGTCLKATVAPTVVPKEDACVDQNRNCPAFAEQGQCQKMFYTFLCPKSCRECDKRQADANLPECTDNYAQATCAALLSQCENPLVSMQCRRSCKVCAVTECRDTIPGTCKTLANIGMCSQSDFRSKCAVTCGLCSTGGSGTTVVSSITSGLATITNTGVCADERSDCQEYFNAGHCRYQVIESVCPKTCQVCLSSTAVLDPDAPCMDSSPTCEIFSRLNQCRSTRNVRFMCAKSCNYCPRIESARKSVVPTQDTQCRDSNAAMCDRLKNMCALPNIETACPLTCGKCAVVDKEGMSSNGQSNRPAGFTKCRDYLPDCPEYRALCVRKSSNNYIPTMCPNTCQTCGQTTAAPTRKPTEPAPTTVATTVMVTTANGVFNKWGSWTECSKTCGGGERTRTRSCIEGECEGPLVDTGACGKDLCDGRQGLTDAGCGDISPLCNRWLQNSTSRCTSVRYREQMKFQCAFSCGHCTPKLVWSDWSDCSNRCGGGKQKRTMSCEVVGECADQTGDGDVEERECNTNDCGTWTTWRDWTPCSVTCGQGYRSRERFCPSGRDDDCEGSPTEQEGCFVNATCPGWSNWSNWTDCSVSCGGGVTTRSRDCYPGKENVTCSGNSTEESNCNNHTCPEWSSWDSWSECSVTCGEGGTRQRFRACSADGKCKGDDADTENCSSDVSCIHWSQWSAYTECSASCGGGVATRNRTCLGEVVGDDGECPGFSEQTMPCNWQICPDVGLWSEWGQFGTCTKTCGGGKMERRRVCLNGIPGEGGCPGTVNEVSECAVQQCPVGSWSLWSEWSACSSSCGVGVKSRDRQCIGGVAGLSGCPGLKESVERCNEHDCPTWTAWQPWTQCSATCGDNGERMRVKVCFDTNIEETVPADECEDSKETFEKELCNVRACPTWAAWSRWGPCSASCGVGLSQRTRVCENGYVGDEGCNDGSSQGKRYCNQWDCPRACETEPIDMAGNFTASSYVEEYSPISAQLSASRAWCPNTDDADQWLQIELAEPLKVSGIKVLGYLTYEYHDGVSGYSWVDRFTVQHAITPGSYQSITNNADEEKVFEGPEGPLVNHASSRFWRPVAARFWRIKIESSVPEQQGCMKVQLLQCQDNAEAGSGSSS